MKNLFESHLHSVCKGVSEVLEANNVNCLFIESGYPDFYYLDDQTAPFRPNPHFLYFCPDMGPGHILKIEPGTKPTLYYYAPDDFWHENASLHGDFWENGFEIKSFTDYEKTWNDMEIKANSVILSPRPEMGVSKGCRPADEQLLSHLHWLRINKTDYEIACVREANKKAAKGHLAAKDAFFSGKSEFEIMQSYLLASGQREKDLPYGNIIALNQHSAILHYQNLKNDSNGKTFLIDAGARHNGYCADITRSYYQESAHSLYKEIRKRVDACEKSLCDMVKPGVDYLEIHQKTHEQIASILVDLEFLKCSVEEALEKDITSEFFPHGVGHGLGLQVHDVGGKQIDEKGTNATPSEQYPYLRTLRTIQNNDVLTIEPGLYFIPMLLDELREDQSTSKLVNWALIQELIPYGGVRIEDDLVATQDGPVNLTREFLPT